MGSSLLREFGPGDTHKAAQWLLQKTESAVLSLNSDFQPPTCGDGVDSEGLRFISLIYYCSVVD